MPKKNSAIKAKKKALKPSQNALTAIDDVVKVTDDQVGWAKDPSSATRRLHTALTSLRAAQRSSPSIIPSRTISDLEALSAWLSQHDVDLNANGLRLSFTNHHGSKPKNVNTSETNDEDDDDVTLFTTRALSAGDCLLQVPASLALRGGSSAAVRHPCLRALAAVVPPVLHDNNSLSLILAILLEAADPDSPFAPYIRALPSRPPIPYLTFDAEQMISLAPSAAATAAMNTLRAQARSYTAVYLAAVRLRLPELSPALLSYSNWEWAVAIAMTRQNQLPSMTASNNSDRDVGSTNGRQQQPTCLALVPVWDMCNHGTGSATTAFIVGNEPCVELTALRDFDGDERVDMFYGRRPNVQLLQYSGFIVRDNPYDQLFIDIPIATDDPLAQFKKRILEKLGVPVSMGATACRAVVGFGQHGLHQALAIAAVACADKAGVAAFLKKDTPLERAPRDASVEEKAVVSEALHSCIAQYPLQTEATASSIQHRQVIALHAAEVKFLQAAISLLSQGEDGLDDTTQNLNVGNQDCESSGDEAETTCCSSKKCCG